MQTQLEIQANPIHLSDKHATAYNIAIEHYKIPAWNDKYAALLLYKD